MSEIKFFKVSSLPGSLEPDSFYYVLNSNFAESYITDSTGVAKSIGNTSMINSLITQALADWSGGGNAVTIVPDYPAMQAMLPSLEENAMLLVIDATGDPTVDTGSALYAYDASTETLYKVAEYESMDMVFEWDHIQGRPNSTPAQIDQAVTNSHTHANKDTLDKLSESGGLLRFSGSPIPAEWNTANW